jgi:membrane protease YdiL (CAAX protease family)
MAESRRRALLALLLIAPVPSIAVLMAVFVAPGPVGRAFWATGKVVLYGLPLVWLLFVERRRPSLSPMRKGGLRTGFLLGLLISMVIVGVWLALGSGWIDRARIREVAETNGFASLPVFLGFGAWIVFGNSLLEEYAFRWFIFTRCRALMPALVAVAASAGIFTVHHVLLLVGYGIAAPIVMLASAGVFLGGLLWSWCYHRYESIWPGYLSHAIVDVAVLAIGWRLISG